MNTAKATLHALHSYQFINVYNAHILHITHIITHNDIAKGKLFGFPSYGMMLIKWAELKPHSAVLHFRSLSTHQEYFLFWSIYYTEFLSIFFILAVSWR